MPNSPDIDPALATEFNALRTQILPKYHKYLNVFSKSKGIMLLPHHQHDHKINIESRMTPPFGPIYSLSEVEQVAL